MGIFDWLFGSKGEKKESGPASGDQTAAEPDDNIGRDVGKGLKGLQDVYGTNGELDRIGQELKDQDAREEAERKAEAARIKAESRQGGRGE